MKSALDTKQFCFNKNKNRKTTVFSRRSDLKKFHSIS